MPDSTGVTARTATRPSLIEAIGQARPMATGWRGRRRAAIGDEELADAILARLPEAEAPAEGTGLRILLADARQDLGRLTADHARGGRQLTLAVTALMRFAEPGPMSATARRKAAAEALRSLDDAAGEAVTAGEPA